MNKIYRYCSVLMFAAWQTSAAAEIPPGYQPASDTDEESLWYAFDRGESLLKHSPLRVSDAALERYLKSVLCRLTPDYCDDFRIYVTLNPEFNAATSGNGALHIWSGMLLRLDNEAQLAALLGHEVAHYLNRDALRQWRTAKQTGAIASVLSFGISPVGDLLSGGFFAGLLPFSQSQELAADAQGLKMMAAAGYNPAEAAVVWQNFADEQAVANIGKGLLIMSTHPGSAGRSERLRRQAQDTYSLIKNADSGHAAYRQAIGRFLPRFLEEQLKARQPDRTAFLLQRLRHSAIGSGDWHFYRGEHLRHIGSEKHLLQAVNAYQSAIANNGPAQALRNTGYALIRLGKYSEAIVYLQRYLAGPTPPQDGGVVLATIEKYRDR